MDYIIRTEKPEDYRTVETLTRRAFWNQYGPGCSEHYLAHVIRSHPDFIPDLALVLEKDGCLIGNVMYTKTRLVDEQGEEKQILTFGPVCIHPDYQRQGYGKKLLEESFKRAHEMGYDTIVIFGSPSNYVSRGFVSCKKHNVCLENGTFPAAMMVKELKPGVLDGRKWVYYESPAFTIKEEDIERFDGEFEKWEKKHCPSQEEFYILSNAVLL